ncbi:MAG: copper homeostasis protein CutC [Gemella sp.]|nr:copper homeostasis protein CutC [Gemella sp.]
MIKEFCGENLNNFENLIKSDVVRIELCDNMAVGGTTPSYGVIKTACDFLHKHDIEVATMIRPRGGDFVYKPLEIEAMAIDILHAYSAGSDYLVLGMLTADNRIDKENLEKVLAAAPKAKYVHHMAFDFINKEDQFEAIDYLIEKGFVRILLHGNAERRSIFENVEHIKKLITYADNRIEIMLGGGVNKDNYQELAKLTGAKIFHGTSII